MQRGVGPQLTETIRRQSGKRIKMHEIVKLTQRDRLRRLRQTREAQGVCCLPCSEARARIEVLLEGARDGRLQIRELEADGGVEDGG